MVSRNNQTNTINAVKVNKASTMAHPKPTPTVIKYLRNTILSDCPFLINSIYNQSPKL